MSETIEVREVPRKEVPFRKDLKENIALALEEEGVINTVLVNTLMTIISNHGIPYRRRALRLESQLWSLRTDLEELLEDYVIE